jgi:hypothetical protein
LAPHRRPAGHIDAIASAGRSDLVEAVEVDGAGADNDDAAPERPRLPLGERIATSASRNTAPSAARLSFTTH